MKGFSLILMFSGALFACAPNVKHETRIQETERIPVKGGDAIDILGKCVERIDENGYGKVVNCSIGIPG